ncbi:uncharacterized protein LOC124641048 [Helicoverpa zea]|uniref:uncharacterized protein LOC124641048 n=1 Tax=Helicoverpa zea TaxID=7113 RepID=UPI001F5960B2|nr:uncharacterized protein LOC124641048 [Helicoverpa zea]
MVLTLYKMDASPPVRAVYMVIEGLKIPNVKYVETDLLADEHLKDEFLKMNPQHTIPLLTDRNFQIWDSHAIITYLMNKYGKSSSLYPTDPEKRALVDLKLHFDSGILYPALRENDEPIFFGTATSLKPEGVAKIKSAYDFTEKFLTGVHWLTGNELTIADMSCVATVSTPNELVLIDEKLYPNITAWIKRCSEFDFYKKGNQPGLLEFRRLLKEYLARIIMPYLYIHAVGSITVTIRLKQNGCSGLWHFGPQLEAIRSSLRISELGFSFEQNLKDITMGLTVYKIDSSSPVRSVFMTIEALNIPDVDYVNVNLLEGEQHKEEFTKLNPQHTVPLLKDDDFCVWDSHAIAVYLVTKYGADDSLYPADPKKRAVIDQRLHFDSGILFPALLEAVLPVFYKGEKSFRSEHLEKITMGYEFAEKFLASSQWFAGDQITLADICCVSSISTMNEIIPIDKDLYPNLAGWLKRCGEQEFYKKGNEPGLEQFRDLKKLKLA